MISLRSQSDAVTFLALSALSAERERDGYLAIACRASAAALYMSPRPACARTVRREVRGLLADLRRARREALGDEELQRVGAEVARSMLFEAWCLRLGDVGVARLLPRAAQREEAPPEKPAPATRRDSAPRQVGMGW